jgi:hypothetical protein
MKTRFLTIGALGVLVFAVPASAHHSFAMFDHNKRSTVMGTVKDFEWINPHTWVHMTTMDASGKLQTWSFEAGSVRQLVAAGWKQDSIKVGDKIEMAFHPLKDGSYGGQILTVTLANGTKLSQGPDAGGGPNRGRE